MECGLEEEEDQPTTVCRGADPEIYAGLGYIPAAISSGEPSHLETYPDPLPAPAW